MLNISQVKLQVNTRTALEITSIYINIRDISYCFLQENTWHLPLSKYKLTVAEVWRKPR